MASRRAPYQRFRHAVRSGGVLLTCLLGLTLPLGAQVGSSTDIIVGIILSSDGLPLGGARVEATSLETGVTKAKTTTDDGRYTILFPDGGGQYRITVRHIGFAPYSTTIGRQADEDRLTVNARLSITSARLPTVTVRGRPAAPVQRAEAGANERFIPGQLLARLPIDPSDPNAIAALAPGVVGISATDSTSAAFSIAGQRPDQNQITLDGLTYGAGSVPQEAVRTTRVVTSTYDVARGQFTGGQVATTTRGGTNDVSGSVSYLRRDPHLEWTDDSMNTAFSGRYTQNQISGGIGGPVLPDKLFYFVSGQFRRRDDPLQSLLSADARSSASLGISADSIARFLSIVQANGLPLNVVNNPTERTNDAASGIVRVDYNLADSHSLMIRGDWQRSLTNASRISAFSLPTNGTRDSGAGGGAMIALSSVFDSFLNELRAYWSTSSRSSVGYLSLPSGRVLTASQLGNGGVALSGLSFGGSDNAGSSSGSGQLEITNETSLLKGTHRWKLGELVNATTLRASGSAGSSGVFTYNSLEDFAANQPASYTRSFAAGEHTNTSLNAALYVGDSWRPNRQLQLTYGVRAEATRYGDAPVRNLAVEEAFGRRTDHFPSEVHVSPRVGFTWMVSGLQSSRGDQEPGGGGPPGGGPPGGGPPGGGPPGGPPPGGFEPPAGGMAGGPGMPSGLQSPLILRGGIGEFRGRVPAQLFASAQQATGLSSGETQLTCIGSAVPTPNWLQYLADPASLPAACADGGTATPLSASSAPNVTTIAPDFTAPRSWRASLGASKRLLGRYNAALDLSYALGTSLYGVRDLNLNTTPQFLLASEGNRPVYVPEASIVPITGASTIAASRRNSAYGYVLDVGSHLQSITAQITATIAGSFTRALTWNLAYTHSRSRDQSSFSSGGGFGGFGPGGAAGGFALSGFTSTPTTGDPNSLAWATSDFERRHSVNATLVWSPSSWMDVTSIVRLTSGMPYSPRVNTDINGDGARNDLAYIYAPNDAPDTALANGMQRLLSSAPASARSCLASQMAHVASRNSCTGDWTTNFDLQANIRPYLGARLQNRFQISLSLLNSLTGLDQLLHGAKHMRGWGQPAFVDQTLLYVRGFDAAQQRYLYTVNERFGSSLAARSFIYQPFQIGVQGTMSVGTNRDRELLPGGGRGIPVADIMTRIAPDPTAAIIADRDTLGLTEAQVASLAAVADAMRAANDSLATVVQQRLDRAGSGADLASIFGQIQPALQEARNNYLAALARVRQILKPEQWEKLPASLRNPTTFGPPAGGPPPTH